MPDIPPELDALWQEYLVLFQSGLRARAKAKLELLVSGIATLDEAPRKAWVRDFLEQKLTHKVNLPLQHSLFRSVVFPVLEAGYRASDFKSTFQLALLAQHLYRDDECWARIGRPSDRELLHSAHRLNPADPSARKALCQSMMARVRHTLHEIPIGVLWGMDGATIEECSLLEKELGSLLEWLKSDERETYRELLDSASLHYTAYTEYLLRKHEFTNYASFLTSREPNA